MACRKSESPDGNGPPDKACLLQLLTEAARMMPRLIFATAFVILFAAALPAAAQQRDPLATLEAIGPDILLQGVIREEDVSLLFDYLRQSRGAAARGETPQESEAFKRRKEEIKRELGVRGRVLADVLMSAAEQAAKEAVREAIRDAVRDSMRRRGNSFPGPSTGPSATPPDTP
jgi:hypothetical protein